MINSIKIARKLGLLAVVATGLFASSSLHAAAKAPSQCKGLESAACSAAESCGWVEGYQRKDGRKVSSFCRTTARSKSKASNKKVVANTK